MKLVEIFDVFESQDEEGLFYQFQNAYMLY